MSDEDIKKEDVLLECLIGHANDVELSTDDEWKEVVMEMLSIDLLESPVFGARSELNISKSFQNLVANLTNPPARRGRPPKAK